MKAYFRHRWDHKLSVHRAAVRLYNGIFELVPFGLKYNFGQRNRRNKIPYSVLNESSTVIQIGAPSDTLHAGRSRAMHFALMVPKGRLIVIEPDKASAEQFRILCNNRGITNVSVYPIGAWSSKKRLRLFVDPRHPATNFTEGSTDYDEGRLQDFISEEIEVDTLENILKAENIDQVDLISITTNGAELEILKGLGQERILRVKNMALARTGVVDDDFMDAMGFERIGYDDRGYTYRRKELVGAGSI